jgi:hypothetical protein
MKMRRASVWGCIVAVLLLASCQEPRQLAGQYGAADGVGKNSQVILTLKGDGKGSWKAHQEEIPFQWETKPKEIWLHSKSGGVIVGKVRGDASIDISLPGVGDYHFVKIE